ncbi:hypothetical protein [Amycolatopsis pithecellobii]|uniref:6-bladed beta-propeller n=1 Tax=Amycolatopsis pithecellobii TaxID=664692 RepID=A0A6N7YMU3_9PSEU|nr:hypothetical protein [Amycolatopsis pithecellobii]MTD54297.1 hypothetical protein [Amycolatopsis pithecellobii]
MVTYSRTGSGEFQFEIHDDWAKLPDGWVLGQAAIVTDAADNVYLYNRSDHPMIVLNADGDFLRAWDDDVIEALFSPLGHPHAWTDSVLRSAHGLFIDEEQNLYFCVLACHVVLKCDLDGRLIQTFGLRDVASNPDWNGVQLQWLDAPPPSAHPPMCLPTDVAVAPDGSVYISDGYGNARIHRYAPDGKLISSFGEPGKGGAGQLHLPHGIWADEERVYVADRENDRIQVFSPDGRPLEIWPDFMMPCDLFMSADRRLYVAECAGPSVCTILDQDGGVLARLDAGDGPISSGRHQLFGGHDLWVDSSGSVYVNRNVDGKRVVKYVRLH